MMTRIASLSRCSTTTSAIKRVGTSSTTTGRKTFKIRTTSAEWAPMRAAASTSLTLNCTASTACPTWTTKLSYRRAISTTTSMTTTLRRSSTPKTASCSEAQKTLTSRSRPRSTTNCPKRCRVTDHTPAAIHFTRLNRLQWSSTRM